jgi:hypothetical protein
VVENGGIVLVFEAPAEPLRPLDEQEQDLIHFLKPVLNVQRKILQSPDG